jgi:hypothetical protein
MTPATSNSFLVECYSPDPATEAARLAGRVEWAAQDAAGVAARVVFRGSIAVPGDEVAMYLFEGPDALVIAAACRDAGVRPDRIVPIVANVREGRVIP